MVEGECVPGEATVRQQRRRDALEAATIDPGGQMEQRPAGAVDQRRGFLELKLPYVAFAQGSTPCSAARSRACASIPREESMPTTSLPVA